MESLVKIAIKGLQLPVRGMTAAEARRLTESQRNVRPAKSTEQVVTDEDKNTEGDNSLK